jgi:hypothetical protein
VSAGILFLARREIVLLTSRGIAGDQLLNDRSIIARLLLRLTLLAQQQAWLEKNHRFCE